jgi:RNA polymerase sigma factor (sigma-70 family)
MDERQRKVTDEASYLDCYRGTVGDVFRYAAMLCGHDRAAAEDLVQDVYLRILRRVIDDELHSLSVGYLTTAVRHRFLDVLKSKERESRRLQLVARRDDDETGSARSTDIELLSRLPERERAAMVLRYVDDLSVGDVASAMGLTRRAAESLLARASGRLRVDGRERGLHHG